VTNLGNYACGLGAMRAGHGLRTLNAACTVYSVLAGWTIVSTKCALELGQGSHVCTPGTGLSGPGKSPLHYWPGQFNKFIAMPTG